MWYRVVPCGTEWDGAVRRGAVRERASRSVQVLGTRGAMAGNLSTWSHLVAVHFSPRMTGQLACREFLSSLAQEQGGERRRCREGFVIRGFCDSRVL